MENCEIKTKLFKFCLKFFKNLFMNFSDLGLYVYIFFKNQIIFQIRKNVVIFSNFQLLILILLLFKK